MEKFSTISNLNLTTAAFLSPNDTRQQFTTNVYTDEESHGFTDGIDDITNESLNSNSSNITTTAPPSLWNQPRLTDFTEVKVAAFLDLYVEALLLYGGIICNLIIVVIFFGKKYQKKSSYIFIHCLAFIDFILLSVVLMTHWVNYNFKKGNKNIYLCKTILFLARDLFDFEAWVIVTMSVDRWIAITYPLKAKFLSNASRARKAIGCIFLGTFAKNIYTFWVAGFALAMNKKNKICTLLYSKEIWIDNLFPWIDLFVGSILPFLMVVTFNCLVIYQIKKSSKKRANMTMNTAAIESQKTREAKESQLSRLMLLISFAFLILTLPRQLFILIWNNISIPVTTHNLAIYALVHSISQKFWFANSSVNFWFYFSSGSQFRRDLKLNALKLCRVFNWSRKSDNGEPSSVSEQVTD